MIAKLHAKELFNKMYYVNGVNPHHTLTKRAAQKCAINVIDEILSFTYYMTPDVKESILDYLKEVKQEIEEL